jgi:hypothetical protein
MEAFHLYLTIVIPDTEKKKKEKQLPKNDCLRD